MGVTTQESSSPAKAARTEDASRLLLLPSHLFFVRDLALPAGIGPEEIESFVEVSLEQISPFALNQLSYGYYLPAGGNRLLMFAAYRKQLAVYEDEEWTAADLVVPEFTSVLGLDRDGPTLVFLQDSHEVTAVFWETAESEVPDCVLSRTAQVNDEEEPPQLEAVREELLRKLGPLPDNLKTLTLERLTGGAIRDKHLAFTLRDETETELSAEIGRPEFWEMDVRDKAFLHATRKVRRQNRWLWATLLIFLACFLALGIFEVALFAGDKILAAREERVLALEPQVEKIKQEEQLANRLEELTGERLLPFAMLDFLNQIRPDSIYFTRVATEGLRSFEVDALTPRSQDVDRYQQLLENSEELEDVQILGLRTRPDGRTSFSIAGTFSEDALNNAGAAEPEEQAAPPADPRSRGPRMPELPDVGDPSAPEEAEL